CCPPVYRCHRAVGKPGKLTGNITKDFWKTGEWIDDFHDIEGDSLPKPWKYTRVKLLWDEEALYVAAELLDDTIWATVMNRDELIYIDNDFEVFLAPQDSSHRYFELEMNAANAVWDLLMEKPQRDLVRRIIGWDIQGLESAVKIDGKLNDPTADNKRWTIELKIPWFSLRECGEDECYPTHFAPDAGEIWRLNFSRVEYEVTTENGRYEKVKDEKTGQPLPEHNWVWAPTGVIDIHMPEMWGYLIFTEQGEDYPLPPEDKVKLHLRKLYYREHAYSMKTGCFTEDVERLLGEEAGLYNIKAYTTPSMFEGIAEFNGDTWHIRQDGYVWKE
ncbi:MAG: carbohydrate-binding family 9-like protein, partial [Clostridia bacterium]|nr:carbohydrate-binding family 9-like protein [Clostridia bacterium]